MNTEFQNQMSQILSADIPKEQKDALLGLLGENIIKNKSIEREELIEKNRKKAQETRERIKEYEKKAYREEIIKNSDKQALEYIEELSELKNKNGEYIYKDLETEYLNGEITKEEIYDLYEKVFAKKEEVYNSLFDKLEEKEQSKESENQEKKGFRKPPRPNKGSNSSDGGVDEASSEEIEPEENEQSPEEIEPEENEIINDRDGSHITFKDRFKEKLKKIPKIGKVLGLAAIAGGVGYAIYQGITTGDSSVINDMMTNISEQINTVANASTDTMSDLSNITNVGDVSEVFVSNEAAMNGNNPLQPSEYLQNQILGYTTTDNQMIEATNLGQINEAYLNGQEIGSIYVGNQDGIDGFVNTIDGVPLNEVLESGGRSR